MSMADLVLRLNIKHCLLYNWKEVSLFASPTNLKTELFWRIPNAVFHAFCNTKMITIYFVFFCEPAVVDLLICQTIILARNQILKFLILRRVISSFVKYKYTIGPAKLWNRKTTFCVVSLFLSYKNDSF